MAETKLGVGIIGVTPAWGWAATAHIPALAALPNYEIRALSATTPEAARAAGEAFGVRAVFSEHEDLVIRPDVDIVAVSVKVPHHRALVSAALAAGKAVYCEWPLGLDLDDARAMADLSASHQVRTIVGLQAPPGPGGRIRQAVDRRRIRRRGPVNDDGRPVGRGRGDRPAQRLHAGSEQR